MMNRGRPKKDTGARFMMSPKTLPFLLVLAILFSLSCSNDEPAANLQPSDPAVDTRYSALSPEELARQPDFGGIVSFLMRSDPRTLNNAIRTDGSTKRICTYVFPPLIGVDPETKEPEPLTAAALPERSADGLVYTWRLREGIKWHDFEESGACLTAHDVKFTFDLISNEKVDAASILEGLALEEIRVLDDLTFETVCSKPYFNSWYTLGREIRIMPSHLLKDVDPAEFNGHPLGREPVGYGPFRFHHWERGSEILITRCDLNREIFPERVRPYLDGIRWKIVADRSMEFILFERGEIDICNMLHDDLAFKGNKESFKKLATVHTYFIPYFNYIGWNTRSPLFSDRRTRRAMAHLMRRGQVLDSHLQGRGKVLSGPFYYFANEYDRAIEPLAFDPDEARRLLGEAGWEDSDGNGILDRSVDGEKKEFRFELLVTSRLMAYQSALFKSMIEDLKSVGIVMDLRALEWGARLALINDRRFDAYNLAKSTDPLFQDYYSMWHSSQAGNKGNNRVGYVNPRVDEILETARVAFDDAKRYGLMREMHRILHEDQPMTGLYTPAVNAAINRRWRNVRIYESRGVYVYDWWLPAESRTPTDIVPPR